MILSDKKSEFKEQLHGELLRFRPGSRFYSVRQLMLRYGVSRRAVDSVLSELEALGAIETRPQSGIYVRRNKLVKQIALLVPDWPSEGNRQFARHLKEEISQSGAEFQFVLVSYDFHDDLAEKIASVPAEVHVVIPTKPALSREEICALARIPSEIVILWSDLSAVSMHSLRADSEFGGMLAAAHFIRRGHRKLALLPSEPRNKDVEHRIAGFLGSARLFGAEAKVIPCDVQPGDYSMSKAHDALETFLKEHGCPFTALFVMSDQSTQGAIAALREAGIRVPEEVSIIGYGNDRTADYFTPQLTSIDGRHPECARELVQAITGLLQGKSEKRLIDITITPTLVERESVRDLKIHSKTGETK